MAQVQYNPVPDGSPQPIATPQVHVNTPGDAFGTGIAKAVEHFGGNLEHVGNELFARALAIQHLNNEAEARDADSQYIIQSGKLYADFESLQGKAAVDAQPKFVQDTADLRTQMRDGLSNQNSQKMFDAQTQSSMARTIFSSARHMATENKKWQVSTIDGNIDARESAALNNPKDENAFQETLRNVRFDVERKADILGVDKDNLLSHHVSQLYASRILGLLRTDPRAAQEMLDNAVKNKQIRGQEAIKLQPVVQGKVDDVTVRNGSDAINAGWDPRMPQVSIDRTVGVEEALTRVLKQVSRTRPDVPFTIGETKSEDGRSISIVPVNKGDEQKISTAMYEAAATLKIPLSTDVTAGKTPGTFSLPQDFDPRSVPKAVEESERSRVNRAKAWAKEQRPDDIVFQNHAAERTMGDYSREVRQRKDEEFNAINTLQGIMQNGYGPDKKLPRTPEELTMTPEGEAAWNRLNETQQGHIRRNLLQISKGDVAETIARRDKFEELRGMASNPEMRAQFLDTNLNEQDLTPGFRSRLYDLKNQVKKEIDKGLMADPRVDHAMKILGVSNILYPARISETDNKAAFNKFRGNLGELMQLYRDEHQGKPPSDEEIRKIGTRLLMSTEVPGRYWGGNWTSKPKVFDLNVPRDVEESIKNDPKWQQDGVIPTPERIQQVYVRAQYQRLYEKKEEVGKPTKAPEPVQPPQNQGPKPTGPKASGQVIEDMNRRGLLTKDQQRAKPKPKNTQRTDTNELGM